MNILNNILLFLIIFFLYHKFIIKKKYNKKSKFKIIDKNIKIKKIKPSKDFTIFEIKNVLSNPNHCLKFLLNNKNKFTNDGSFYPGIKMDLPYKLKNEIIELMLLINKNYYKIRGNIRQYYVGISQIEKPIDQLELSNVFPHQDCSYYKNHKKSGLAIVIYLCNPGENYGGTNIYKEKIPLFSKEFYESEKYKNFLEKYNNLKNNLSYDIDITDFFKLIYKSKIEFNKAIIYKTNYYHRAEITNKYFYNNENLKIPRYTITGFICFDKKLKSPVFDFYQDYDYDNHYEYLNNWYKDGTENEILKPKYYL